MITNEPTPHSNPRRPRLSHLLALAAAAGVALSGCDLGNADTDIGSNEALSFEDFMNDVAYKEPWEGGVFIVNGDTAIGNEKQLREFHARAFNQGSALIVHRPGNTVAAWSAAQRKNLTYCVSNAFGANKALIVAAMNNATGAWEAASDVDFIHLEAQDGNCNANNQNVLFDIGQVTGQPYLARAFFPDSPRAIRNVLVDTSSFGNLGAITLEGIMRHELGHVLGFRHEHTRPEAGTCFEDNAWQALTAYDSASVMHYPQCNGTGTDLSLTATDIQGAAALYGAPGAGNPPGTPPGNPPPGAGTPQTVTLTDQAVQRGQLNDHGSVPVVAGSQITIQIAGTGDADLYLRFNSAPTRVQFDCRPYLVSSNETCALDVPADATTAHVMVDGYTAANYTLTATWVQP